MRDHVHQSHFTHFTHEQSCSLCFHGIIVWTLVYDDAPPPHLIKNVCAKSNMCVSLSLHLSCLHQVVILSAAQHEQKRCSTKGMNKKLVSSHILHNPNVCSRSQSSCPNCDYLANAPESPRMSQIATEGYSTSWRIIRCIFPSVSRAHNLLFPDWCAALIFSAVLQATSHS